MKVKSYRNHYLLFSVSNQMEEPGKIRLLNFVRIISFAVSLRNSMVVLRAVIS